MRTWRTRIFPTLTCLFEMRISKRHVSVGNILVRQVRIGDRHCRIRQTRATNGPEMIEFYNKPLDRPEVVCKSMKRLELAALRGLAVTGMKSGNLVILASDRCGYTAIHSTAHQNHGFHLVGILLHPFCVGPVESLDSNSVSAEKSKGQTPFKM